MRDYRLYLKDILAALESVETLKERLPRVKQQIQKILKELG